MGGHLGDGPHDVGERANGGRPGQVEGKSEQQQLEVVGQDLEEDGEHAASVGHGGEGHLDE